MDFITCNDARDLPPWLIDNHAANEAALGFIDEGWTILIVRRNDGAVQVVTQGYLDLEAVELLIRWVVGP